MRFESEVVAEKIVPAVRKILADKLHDDYAHTQEEIALELELTQPAVSQYLKDKRSDEELVEEMRSDPQLSVLLDDAASIAAKEEDFSDIISEIIETGRDKGIFSDYFEDTRKVL